MKRCPTCGEAYPADAQYCARDGDLLESIPSRPSSEAGEATTHAPAPQSAGWRVGAALALALTLAAAGAWLWARASDHAEPFLRAVDAGDWATADSLLSVVQATGGPDAVAALAASALDRVVAPLDGHLDRWRSAGEAPDNAWGDMARRATLAAALAPHDAHARARRLYVQGQAVQGAGRPDSAAALYAAATAADPSWALPVNSLGVLANRRDAATEATEFYERAAALDPDWLFPHLNLMNALFEAGATVRAEPVARRVLELDPDRGFARYVVAASLADQGRYREAVQEAEAALAAAPTGDSGLRSDVLQASLPTWRDGAAGIPTESDGRHVLERLAERDARNYGSRYRITSFRKTNGQRAEVYGIATYTMDYEMSYECIQFSSMSHTALIGDPCGGRRSGRTYSRTGRLEFSKTERGWRGPSGGLYGPAG
ncbi:hypothetical protein [Rubrivirga sp. IMCC43871]|uniref:hypothetical protein n=1 Tax=Rubrivirga sp. IMCC43871 TaxID=3391575 RepID=UPI00399028B0